MELRCQRKGSVSYGLGADFSLPRCLVGNKVSESIAEPSPAGISEPRAEISWCIVMVQRSGKVSGGTVACEHPPPPCRLYFSLFFSHFDIKAGKSPVGKEAFHSCPLLCPCQIVDGYCVLFIALYTLRAGGIATLRCPRSRACFTGNFSANLERFSEMSGKHEIIRVQQEIKTREIRNLLENVTEKLGGYSKFPEEGNFIGQKCLERPMCILRPFRVEEKRWSCSV